ncbi:MAG: transporter [Ilumatobacteraceae bacterium]|nr:transporter [Ilumatobacteraceae bacterium]
MLFRMTLQGLWARKRRVIGTATAVVLGVAFLAATLVLGDTLDSSFGTVFRQANAGTDVVVRSATSINSDQGRQRANLDASLVDQVAAVPGVAAAVGEINGTAQILGSDGSPIGGEGPPTDAGAWVGDAKLNPYTVTSGRAPANGREAVIDAHSAAEGGLAVGDTATIRTPDPVEVEVVGLVGFGDETSMAGATYIGLTEDQAVDLLGQPGEVSDIRVRGDGSASAAELSNAIAEVVPEKAEAITGAELTAEQQQDIQGDFLGFLKYFLLAFAGVALVVATFSIANTFMILSAQRSRESALMRAIGAGRSQVLGIAMIEAVVIGALASAVGLAAGLGLALGLKALLAGFGLDLPGDGLVVQLAPMVISFGIGLAATLVAATMPAVRSSRIAPIEALRDSAAESTSVSKIRTGIGVAVAALGTFVMVTATSSAEGAMSRAGIGALLIFVAAVTLGPVIARPAAAVIGAPVAGTRGLVGQLARRNAMRNPRRTSGAALALVIGAAVVALFATFGSSLSRSIDDTVSQSFGGDLVVMQDGFSSSGLSPQLATTIDGLPEVSETVGLSNVIATVDGTTVYPTAGDPAAMADLLDLDVQRGDLAQLPPGQIAITEGYATDEGLALGEELTMEFADGESSTFEVGAVYGVGELLGDIVMNQADWTPHELRPGNVAVLVGLEDGTSLEQGRQAVEQAAEAFGAPKVEDRDQYIDRVAGQVNQLLTLVYGMLVLAIIIALIGLANTLSLSIHERSRELGLLRAVGLTRGKLRAMVRWESVITAVVGTVVGLGVGTFLGWGLVRALSAQEGFVSFQLPTPTLAVVLVLSIGAGVLAAVRPAHRAAKLDVLAAIAES